MASFYTAKIAALFHDPAWKPWIVGRAEEEVGRVLAWKENSRPRGEGVEECEGLTRRLMSDLKAHELDAVAAVIDVMPDAMKDISDAVVEELTGRDSAVRRADRLAASLDRWMLIYSRKAESPQIKVLARDTGYANPLEPKFKIKAREDIEPGTVCRYVKSIKELFKDMSKARLPLSLQYNILYMLLEPLWYTFCRECVPLADTRTPTHTVFDHVYATAAMVNFVWFANQKSPVSGFFVKIDVAGIQRFISASRKVRDLWAGSWLVSALSWATVSDAVKLLGADVVLSPYIGANHFYIASILEELKRQSSNKQDEPGFYKAVGECSKLLDCIEGIIAKAYLWMGAANQPIAPGTLFIALPCLDQEAKEGLLSELKELKTVDKKALKDLVKALASCDPNGVERYIRERFHKAWRRLVNAIVSEETLGVKNYEDLAKKLSAVTPSKAGEEDIKAYKDYLEKAGEIPPLHLRVTVIRVEDAYRELLGKLQSISEAHEVTNRFDVSLDDVAEKLLFTYLFNIIVQRQEGEELARNVTVEPGFTMASTLEAVTKNGYYECTVCSRLPAVIRIEDPDKLSRKLGVPRTFFTSGEQLCPYCLYRRLLTLNTVLVKAMENLGLYVSPKLAGNVYPRPPSTCELAAVNAIIKLADKLVEMWRSKRDEFKMPAESFLKDNSRLSSVNVYAPLRAYVWTKCGRDIDCVNDVLRVLSLLEDVFDVSCLLISLRGRAGEYQVSRCVEFYCGPGGKECNGNELARIDELCENLFSKKGLLSGVNVDAGIYYTIVRGDGDHFGSKIVRGFVDYNSVRDYILEVLNAISDNVARSRLSKELVWLTDEMSKIALKLGLEEPPRSLVTPAYYTALSRGQMITAITDSALAMVLAGFPVYAGGDDVAVLAPGYIDKGVLESLMEYYRRAGVSGNPLSTVIGDLLNLMELPYVTGFAGAEAVYVTRLNYWGMLQPREFHGFHRMPIGALYPAPAAYGRSYGMLVAHYRDPFQAAWRSAGALEELKDVLGFRSVDCKSSDKIWKDAVFLAYGRVTSLAGMPFQVVPLPNRVPGDSKVDVSRLAYMTRRSIDLASETDMENGAVSKSIFTDFASECTVVEKAAHEALERCDPGFYGVALKLATMLATRNARSPGKAERARELVLSDSVQIIPIAEDEEAGELVACRSFPPWLIVSAAKYILASRR